MIEIAPLRGQHKLYMWLLFMAIFCVANTLVAALPHPTTIELSRFINVKHQMLLLCVQRLLIVFHTMKEN